LRVNGELPALSGPRNPYPGKSGGGGEKDAQADLLVFNGDPIADIALPARSSEPTLEVALGRQRRFLIEFSPSQAWT